LEKNSEDGQSIAVQRPWSRDDEDERPEAAEWIKEQYERLRAVLAESQSGAELTYGLGPQLALGVTDAPSQQRWWQHSVR